MEKREFFYEKRKEPKKVSIAFTAKPETLERIDALKMGTESRSAVIRRIIDAGLPAIERQTKLIRSPQAKLGPIAEEDKEQ